MTGKEKFLLILAITAVFFVVTAVVFGIIDNNHDLDACHAKGGQLYQDEDNNRHCLPPKLVKAFSL